MIGQPSPCRAGAAQVDVSPESPLFLYGYPHVPRFSTGVHDPLMASAMFLDDGRCPLLILAADVILLTKATTARVRERIAAQCGVPAGHILLGATHTHSGPVTGRYVSNDADPIVPQPCPTYMAQLEDGLVEAAIRAVSFSRPAELTLAVADGSCVGTNRRDPAGPRDQDVPVILAHETEPPHSPIGMVTVCAMHPTVLHEDSTLVSADLHGMARRQLQQAWLGASCPVVGLTGVCGNLSPRHVTRANTFAEAQRLGAALGQAIEKAVRQDGKRIASPQLGVACAGVDLPLRTLPEVVQAQAWLDAARARLAHLRDTQTARTDVRTAEVDLFGAEETLALARAAESGRIEAAAADCLPAEVQALRIGPWRLVAWPGELFVEFALQVKAQARDTFLISLANGDLQGYLVTQQAVDERAYEAGNAIFASPESGQRMVAATLDLIARLTDEGGSVCPPF
jgi:neutral ceramidase